MREPVTPGRTTGDLTVVGMGVAVGDQVVVDGQSRLVPGAKVEIQAPPRHRAAAAGRQGPVRGTEARRVRRRPGPAEA